MSSRDDLNAAIRGPGGSGITVRYKESGQQEDYRAIISVVPIDQVNGQRARTKRTLSVVVSKTDFDSGVPEGSEFEWAIDGCRYRIGPVIDEDEDAFEFNASA